jgi:hypothetical protein
MKPDTTRTTGLTDADIAFIKDAPMSELREELRYATLDKEYSQALAAEILRRAKAEGKVQP